jgi:hypothetical protein
LGLDSSILSLSSLLLLSLLFLCIMNIIASSTATAKREEITTAAISQLKKWIWLIKTNHQGRDDEV